MTDHNDIRAEIINWSINFPIDRIWRKKYNIPFNSSIHREVSFIDQLIDIEEDKFFEELYSSIDYIPNIGDWLKIPDISKENLEDSIKNFREEFKDLDKEE